MKKRSIVVLAVAIALASCATPESQLATGLQRAGLNASTSTCMAERMADRLTLDQLLKLRSLGQLGDKRPQSAAEFLRKVRALGDPEIVGIATSSLAVCGLGL